MNDTEARDRLTRCRQRNEELHKALLALVTKVEECGEASVGVFQFAAVHGYTYSGPNWTKELEAAKAVMS